MRKFTRPGKSEAYQTACDVSEQLSDDELLERGWRVFHIVRAKVAAKHSDLPKRDVEHVAGAALRDERGKRRRR